MEKNSKKLIIITAPSGAGKTSITHYLLNKYPNLSFSISAATREPRGAEANGRDYYFITADEFKKNIHENAFVEWEMVYEGKYYGTLKSELERIWDEGRIPVLDIDVQGAIHVQQEYPDAALSIFIEPPSIEELKKRLETRSTETEKNITTRLNKAAYEISFKKHFDRIIVNDDLEKACKVADAIVEEFINK
jgi:guanylate kinase